MYPGECSMCTWEESYSAAIRWTVLCVSGGSAWSIIYIFRGNQSKAFMLAHSTGQGQVIPTQGVPKSKKALAPVPKLPHISSLSQLGADLNRGDRSGSNCTLSGPGKHQGSLTQLQSCQRLEELMIMAGDLCTDQSHNWTSVSLLQGWQDQWSLTSRLSPHQCYSKLQIPATPLPPGTVHPWSISCSLGPLLNDFSNIRHAWGMWVSLPTPVPPSLLTRLAETGKRQLLPTLPNTQKLKMGHCSACWALGRFHASQSQMCKKGIL